MAEMIGFIRTFANGKEVGKGSRIAEEQLEAELMNTPRGLTSAVLKLFRDGSGILRLTRGDERLELWWNADEPHPLFVFAKRNDLTHVPVPVVVREGAPR